jgi:Flp pilus assembly protein TadG
MKSIPRQARQRGAVAPLTIILLVPLVGMLAFSVDMGYIVVTQAELQNAADAAALAGAEKLQALYVQFNLPQQSQQQQIFTTATTNTGTCDSPMYTAEQYSAYNQAGGVYVTMQDADVSFSYVSVGSAPQQPNYPGNPNVFPNTITVTTRRDNVLNGPLGLFFAPIFGVNQVNLTATASATIYSGDVASLQVIPGVDAHILPVALDVNVWKTFLQTGVSPDGTVHDGPNGAPQLHIYPCPGNAPGNFGLLDVGPPTNNVPAFRNWVDDGITPNDIEYLLTNHLLPVSPDKPEWWKCGPGLDNTLVSNFQSAMGQQNLIPLFIPVNDGITVQPYQAAQGQGSGTYYDICGFAAIVISQADGNGSGGMDISIQPAATVDPTAVLTNIQPAASPPPLAGSQTSFFGTQSAFISAKLTQ